MDPIHWNSLLQLTFVLTRLAFGESSGVPNAVRRKWTVQCISLVGFNSPCIGKFSSQMRNCIHQSSSQRNTPTKAENYATAWKLQFHQSAFEIEKYHHTERFWMRPEGFIVLRYIHRLLYLSRTSHTHTHKMNAY